MKCINTLMSRVFYTIYRITNKINGKTYLGKHQTVDLNDSYMGSGKLIRLAIRKHGKENFVKEVLYVFDTENEMNAKEAELVDVGEHTYNMCSGGKGGWSYVNDGDTSKEYKMRGGRRAVEKGAGWHSLESRKKAGDFWKKNLQPKEMREKNRIAHLGMKMPDGHQQGEKNSQSGTFWITNGIDNAKTRGYIPENWKRGRSLKRHTGS